VDAKFRLTHNLTFGGPTERNCCIRWGRSVYRILGYLKKYLFFVGLIFENRTNVNNCVESSAVDIIIVCENVDLDKCYVSSAFH
jgi:hypothetical protein